MSTNCLVTKLKGNTNNDNLPYFNKVSLKCETLKPGTFHFNQSIYSIVSFMPGASGKIKIIGDGTTVFSDGSKEAFISSSPVVNVTTVGDKFTLLIDDKDKIKSICFPNADQNIKITIDPFLNISSLSNINAIFLNQEVIGNLGEFEIGINVDNYNENSTNNLIGKITSIKSHNLKILNTNVIPIRADAIINADFHLIEICKIYNIIDGSITIKQLADAFTYGGNQCKLKNWGYLINDVHNAGVYSGDIMDIPSNVFYTNTTNLGDSFTCTLGKRNTSDCEVLCCGGGTFKLGTKQDVDNFLINNSTCTFTIDGRGEYTYMYITVPETYTPSHDAQIAISALKQKGVTEIKVNGIDL